MADPTLHQLGLGLCANKKDRQIVGKIYFSLVKREVWRWMVNVRDPGCFYLFVLAFLTPILKVTSWLKIIHVLGNTKEKGEEDMHGLQEVPLGISTYIALARIQSCDPCARVAGKHIV